MGPRLDGVRRLPDNASLEALAAMDDALLVGAEGGDEATAPFWLAPLERTLARRAALCLSAERWIFADGAWIACRTAVSLRWSASSRR